MISPMTCVVTLPAWLTHLKYDYFDGFVVVWLIIGLFWGRKKGMSQELLPTLQWIAIVVVAGLFYRSLSDLVRQYAGFEVLWSNVFAYLLLAFGVHLIYLFCKHLLNEKLVGTDLFGRAEYYLGMISGVVRCACMLLAALALMNSRIITKAERARTEKMQSENFSDIRFPTYGSVQQAILFDSLTGSLVETNLQAVLIYPAPPGKPKNVMTHAKQQEQDMDMILGHQK
jgi:uncharacterized membrane protein required for colicin V production